MSIISLPNLKFTQPGYRALDILTPHVHKKILHVTIKQSINIKHEKLGVALKSPVKSPFLSSRFSGVKSLIGFEPFDH